MASGWDGIEEFLAVYDCGRFALAAEALGLSPSHVSRAIQRLEAKLQARLFVRSTRQVTPTETGHAFALSCRKLVETRDESFRAIAAQGAPTGSLRITCPVAFGERHVAPVLRRLVEAYPQIEVALDLDNRVLDLAAHRYDLAIRTGRLSDSRLIGTRIATRRLHLAAAPPISTGTARRQGLPTLPAMPACWALPRSGASSTPPAAVPTFAPRRAGAATAASRSPTPRSPASASANFPISMSPTPSPPAA